MIKQIVSHDGKLYGLTEKGELALLKHTGEGKPYWEVIVS